jgi:methionine synthase II (cobalamin-independent)
MVELGSGWVTGVGSLPHRDAGSAIAEVMACCADLPYVPQLPGRSVNELMIAQSLAGVAGITVSAGGEIGLAPGASWGRVLDDAAGSAVDLDHDAFFTTREFLSAVRGTVGAVKWQMTGPVTLATALHRAGVASGVVLDRATSIVERGVSAIHRLVSAALPSATQVVVLDEPCLGVQPGRELWPATACIDAVASAVAGIGASSVAAVHCCAEADWSAVLATGAAVLSMPPFPSLVCHAGELARFLERGGWVAWGAVPTDASGQDGPERFWRELDELWNRLGRCGCDEDRLRTQALITPACGLATVDSTRADRVMQLTSGVGMRVRDRAVPGAGARC